jgi:phosphoribosyl 1,2-cyclic phosphodiesterase
MDRFRFRSLASGSSGNCYYIGNGKEGILIDAGVGVRATRKFLRSMGVDFNTIWGVFITHDHVDHILSAGVIGEKHFVPVYATQKVHEGINRNYRVTQKLKDSQRFFNVGDSIVVSDFHIKSFPVSHDASESVGFSVEYKGKRITIATDLGFVDDEAINYLIDSDYIVLEANYDEDMLANGNYPRHLQKRISGITGHLSNTQAAEFLVKNFSEKWKYVFLCHLSKENNHPDVVYTTIIEHFNNKNIDRKDLKIIPLERMTPSALFVL